MQNTKEGVGYKCSVPATKGPKRRLVNCPWSIKGSCGKGMLSNSLIQKKNGLAILRNKIRTIVLMRNIYKAFQ